MKKEAWWAIAREIADGSLTLRQLNSCRRRIEVRVRALDPAILRRHSTEEMAVYVFDRFVDQARKIAVARDPEGYVRQLVHHAAIDFGRATSRRNKHSAIYGGIRQGDPAIGQGSMTDGGGVEYFYAGLPDNYTINRELVEHTKVALRLALTDEQREVVHRYYLLQQTLEEIASILDVPKATVAQRLSRARKILRKKLRKLVE